MVETTQYVDPTNLMSPEYSQPNSYHQANIQSANKTDNYGNNTPLYSGSASEYSYYILKDDVNISLFDLIIYKICFNSS